MEYIFPVKWILFLGQWRPVVLQSENGPCPLLAIANVVSLVGRFPIPEGTLSITGSELVAHVAEYIIEYNARKADIETESIMSSVIPFLPKLLSGLDVDPFFDHCKHFTQSAETAVFDAADVRLFHGWVFDPESEPEAAACLSGLTYNSVLDKVVVCLGSPAAASHMKGRVPSIKFSPGAQQLAAIRSPGAGIFGAGGILPAPSPVSLGTPGVGATEGHRLPDLMLPTPAKSVVLGASGAAAMPEPDLLTLPAVTPLREAAGSEPAGTEQGTAREDQATTSAPGSHFDVGESHAPPTPAEPKPVLHEPVPDVTSPDLKPSLHPSPSPAGQGHPMSPPLRSSTTVTAEDRQVAQVLHAWLEQHQSQLTTEGVKQLVGELREKELAVFFRNNHFATLFKQESCLYALVTDAGFLDVDSAVWERLDADSIRGETVFVDAHFRAPRDNATPIDEEQVELEAALAESRAAQAAAPGLPPLGLHALGSGPTLAAIPSSQPQSSRLLPPPREAPGPSSTSSATAAPPVQDTHVPPEVPDDMRADYLLLGPREREDLLSMLREAVVAESEEVEEEGQEQGAHAARQHRGAPQQSSSARGGETQGQPRDIRGRNDRYAQQATTLRGLAAERETRQAHAQGQGQGGAQTSRPEVHEAAQNSRGGGQASSTTGAKKKDNCCVQ